MKVDYFAEPVVQFEYLGAIELCWIFRWMRNTERNAASDPVVRDFPRVEFVRKVDLYGVSGKSYRPQTPRSGVDTCNSGDDEICFPKIKKG